MKQLTAQPSITCENGRKKAECSMSFSQSHVADFLGHFSQEDTLPHLL